MINAEKFKKEIRAMTDESTTFAFKADDPTVIRKCNDLDCNECLFNCGKCFLERTRWIVSEYKEPIKLTRLEYEILKYVQKKGFNFITRNNSDYLYGDLYGNLFIYEIKPIKHDGIVGWCTTGESYVLYAFNDLFQFVKWEDEKPTSIKEVLENCAVENIKEGQ